MAASVESVLNRMKNIKENICDLIDNLKGFTTMDCRKDSVLKSYMLN